MAYTPRPHRELKYTAPNQEIQTHNHTAGLLPRIFPGKPACHGIRNKMLSAQIAHTRLDRFLPQHILHPLSKQQRDTMKNNIPTDEKHPRQTNQKEAFIPRHHGTEVCGNASHTLLNTDRSTTDLKPSSPCGGNIGDCQRHAKIKVACRIIGQAGIALPVPAHKS